MKEIRVRNVKEIEGKILYDGSIVSKRLINKQRDNSENMSFHYSNIKSGWKHEVSNDDQDEIMFFLQGKAKLSWDGKEVEVSKGDCIYIPSGCKLFYDSQGDAVVIAVLSPPAE